MIALMEPTYIQSLVNDSSKPEGRSSELAIKVRNLHKSFGAHHVLRGVGLDVYNGETMVIIGGSGCGKSVFLRHLVGLHKPDKGTVEIFGTDLRSASDQKINDLRRKISLVFQSAALFNSLTVEENVGLALREHRMYDEKTIHQIVMEKLSMVGLADDASKLPETLSGGMRKRVALARALATDPDIILYDEPTAELDPFFAQTIDMLVKDLQQRLRKTAVVVTHDMVHAFRIADRIGMLHEGELIFLGTPEEIQKIDHPVISPFIRREGLKVTEPLPHQYDVPPDEDELLEEEESASLENEEKENER